MFSTPESGKISDRWTCVEIAGGDELDDAGREFMERYDVRGYPTLLAVTAGGALIERDLMQGRMRQAEYLYQAMEKADATNAGFLERKAALSDDVASRLELADLHLARQELSAAAELLRTTFEAEPSAELAQRILELHARQGERDAETALLDDVIGRFPEAEEHIGWRMRRATIHIPPPTSEAEQAQNAAQNAESLEGLRATLAEEKNVEDEAFVRVSIARLLHAIDRAPESQAHVDWVFENAPSGRSARIAHLFLAKQAHGKRDAETVDKHAAAVFELDPKSREAATAHMMLGDLAYGDHDLDAMEKHFTAVVELAPHSSMAKDARNALEFLARRRARDGN